MWDGPWPSTRAASSCGVPSKRHGTLINAPRINTPRINAPLTNAHLIHG